VHWNIVSAAIAGRAAANRFDPWENHMRNPSRFLLAGVILAGSAFAALAQTSTQNPSPPPPMPSASPSASPAQSGSMQNPSQSAPHQGSGMARMRYQKSGMARASGKSDHIQQAQQALNQNGESLQVDGVMGSKTKAALKDFQTKHNLKVTGRLDRATRKALKPTG
jgi:hypothetical protein